MAPPSHVPHSEGNTWPEAKLFNHALSKCSDTGARGSSRALALRQVRLPPTQGVTPEISLNGRAGDH